MEDMRFYGNYDLNDEGLPFNWFNTDFDMTSKEQAAQLVAANELIEEVDPEDKDHFQEMVWNMLTD